MQLLIILTNNEIIVYSKKKKLEPLFVVQSQITTAGWIELVPDAPSLPLARTGDLRNLRFINPAPPSLSPTPIPTPPLFLSVPLTASSH